MIISTETLLEEMKLIRTTISGLNNRRGIMNCDKLTHEKKIVGLEHKLMEITLELKRRGLKVVRKRKRDGDGQNRAIY